MNDGIYQMIVRLSRETLRRCEDDFLDPDHDDRDETLCEEDDDDPV